MCSTLKEGDVVWVRGPYKTMGAPWRNVVVENVEFPIECRVMETYSDWAKVIPVDRKLMTKLASWWNFRYSELYRTPSDEYIEKDLFEI